MEWKISNLFNKFAWKTECVLCKCDECCDFDEDEDEEYLKKMVQCVEIRFFVWFSLSLVCFLVVVFL